MPAGRPPTIYILMRSLLLSCRSGGNAPCAPGRVTVESHQGNLPPITQAIFCPRASRAMVMPVGPNASFAHGPKGRGPANLPGRVCPLRTRRLGERKACGDRSTSPWDSCWRAICSAGGRFKSTWNGCAAPASSSARTAHKVAPTGNYELETAFLRYLENWWSPARRQLIHSHQGAFSAVNPGALNVVGR